MAEDVRDSGSDCLSSGPPLLLPAVYREDSRSLSIKVEILLAPAFKLE